MSKFHVFIVVSLITFLTSFLCGMSFGVIQYCEKTKLWVEYTDEYVKIKRWSKDESEYVDIFFDEIEQDATIGWRIDLRHWWK